MDLDWVSEWANYLVAHREIRNWEDFAREAAEAEVERAWSILGFYKDPSELWLSDRAIAEHADDQADWFFIHGGLRLFGIEVWEKYRDQADVSKAESAAWIKAYIAAYREEVDERVDRLIPEELRDKLDFFCRLVSGMRRAIDYGETRGRRPFRIRLGDGGRKRLPDAPGIRPTRREIVARAERVGRESFESDWKETLHGDGRVGFSAREARHGTFLPLDWGMTEADERLFERIQSDAYLEALEDRLPRFAPPEAWRNASLICLVYDRMVEQGLVKVKKGEDKGFGAFRGRREKALREEREKWENEMRERERATKKGR